MSTYGLWLSAAGMKVSDHRQTLLANNMANMQTPGFKHDLAVITQRRVEANENRVSQQLRHPVLDMMSGGANVRPAFWSHRQGPIEATGKPLDVAIEGEGFFAVGDGQNTSYTRNGAFSMNSMGEVTLPTESGRWKLLDQGGNPLRVDPAGAEIEVSGNGTVRQGGAIVGIIGVHQPATPRTFTKLGENLFTANSGEMKALPPKLRSGALESSSLDVMDGLASMIEASRAYQMNASLIQMQDEMTGKAMELGKVA